MVIVYDNIFGIHFYQNAIMIVFGRIFGRKILPNDCIIICTTSVSIKEMNAMTGGVDCVVGNGYTTDIVVPGRKNESVTALFSTFLFVSGDFDSFRCNTARRITEGDIIAADNCIEFIAEGCFIFILAIQN